MPTPMDERRGMALKIGLPKDPAGVKLKMDAVAPTIAKVEFGIVIILSEAVILNFGYM